MNLEQVKNYIEEKNQIPTIQELIAIINKDIELNNEINQITQHND